MRKPAAFLCLFVVAVCAGFSQEKQERKEVAPPATATGVPAEEAKRENPVKPTETSLADGKKLYGYQCAMCHGDKGDGKGDLFETMKLKTKDWTNPESLKDFSDGSLYYLIEKGKGQMPAQEGRMSVNQKWNMINYIRTLAKKPAEAAKAAPVKQ